MDVAKISTGKAPPHDIHVVIEIPQGSAVKYEVEKDSGAIFVDRFLFHPDGLPRRLRLHPRHPGRRR